MASVIEVTLVMFVMHPATGTRERRWLILICTPARVSFPDSRLWRSLYSDP
jgi:hypothetical protein